MSQWRSNRRVNKRKSRADRMRCATGWTLMA
jgi:hypothetical protein